jgi:hypothetical protein
VESDRVEKSDSIVQRPIHEFLCAGGRELEKHSAGDPKREIARIHLSPTGLRVSTIHERHDRIRDRGRHGRPQRRRGKRKVPATDVDEWRSDHAVLKVDQNDHVGKDDGVAWPVVPLDQRRAARRLIERLANDIPSEA